ncbi:MAG: hypothetical protein HGGPFJEG_00183 [Ignavibacteria bacterium]|nr:hypothetical protein [Ignavibacteria bacterium]
MKITQKYSHLNGEEYLKVHHKKLYNDILKTIESINAKRFKTKRSKEKTKLGKLLYSPTQLNKIINKEFRRIGWNESRYKYYITTEKNLIPELLSLSLKEQKLFLSNQGIKPILSYKQTDLVKDQVAIEIQFGKYAFVAFDLFVKHMLFYSGGIINVGIEVLPTKNMQSQMSSGIAYYEGEVYNILRHGRSNPPVPLLILGIEL